MSLPFSSVLGITLKNVKHCFRKINCETLLQLQTNYSNLWVVTEESRQRADFMCPSPSLLKTISYAKRQKPQMVRFSSISTSFCWL